MTLRALPVALLALLALAAPALAQDGGGPTTLRVVAHDEGSDFWFTVEGLDGRNPLIVFQPGSEVTVEFVNEGPSAHNVHFAAPIDQATEVLTAGGTATLRFQIPADASGQFEYWCDPHRTLDMAGPFRIGEGGGGGGNPPPPTGAPEEPPVGPGGGSDLMGLAPVVALAVVALAIVVLGARLVFGGGST